MTKLKFFHPITGALATINVSQGIMRDEKGNKTCISINKVLNHMWSQGYVRAGKSVVLTDFEKLAIKEAPKVIEEMKKKIHEQEVAKFGAPVVTERVMPPALALPSEPVIQQSSFKTRPDLIIYDDLVQVETKPQLSTAEKLAALRNRA